MGVFGAPIDVRRRCRARRPRRASPSATGPSTRGSSSASPSTRARRSSTSTRAPSAGRRSSRETSSTPRPAFSPQRRSGPCSSARRRTSERAARSSTGPPNPCVAKGKEAPVQAWLALRATAAIGERPATPVPMIGRDRELGVLTGIWERVVDEGRSHFVTRVRAGGHRQVADRARARAARRRTGRARHPRPLDALRRVEPVQRVRSAGEADRADLRQRRARRSARRSSPTAIASLAGPAAAEEHAPNLATLLGLDGDREAADREQLFFSARVLVESLAMRGPDAARVRGHPLGGRQPARPARDVRRPRARRARSSSSRSPGPELLGERPGWGGGLPAYTALPLEPLGDAAGRELADASFSAASTPTMRAETGRRDGGGQPALHRGARHVASANSRRRGSTSCRRASARSSPRGSTRCRPTSAPFSSTPRSSAACSGVARCARSTTARTCRRLLGSLEARDLIQREAVSRIQGDQQFALQARADPRRRLRDAPARGAPREARGGRALPRGDDRRRPVARGARATTGARRARTSARVEHLVAAGDQAGRGWAKQRAVRLYREALELLGEDDAAPTRRHAEAGGRPPGASTTSRDVGARGGRRAWLAGVVGEREVGRRHVAGDLVDRRQRRDRRAGLRARAPSPRSARRRCRTTSGSRPRRRRRGCAPRRSPG